MPKQPRDTDAELVVYFVLSPEWGRGHWAYTDEDILASGGMHAIEKTLEEESYWFVRLGVIRGELGEIDKLPVPPDDAWVTGRRNPAFAGSELGRHVFRATFQAVERMLDSWKREQDGGIEAYSLKELKISPGCLVSLTHGLRNLQQVHDIARITVTNHWYDPSWPGPYLSDDLVLAEFSFFVPFQVRWSTGEKLVSVEVMPLSSC